MNDLIDLNKTSNDANTKNYENINVCISINYTQSPHPQPIGFCCNSIVVLASLHRPMVLWLACLIFTAAIGVRIQIVAVKFHNVYDNAIVRHPWQVSENHKPRVHPSHEGNWAVS